MSHKQKIGKKGEYYAKEYLISQGYSYITSNFYTKYGEIDLIFKNKGNIVFVEVKTRTNLNFGFPEEAITKTKLKKIKLSFQQFFNSYPEFSRLIPKIEVITVLFTNMSSPEVGHIKNVV